MSPFGAIATAFGWLNVSGAFSRHSRLAERHQYLSLGSELENLVTLAVLALSVRDPDIAVLVDTDAVRKDKHPLPPKLLSSFPD